MVSGATGSFEQSPAQLSLFRGDIGTSEFTVTATREAPVDIFSVVGEACATNTARQYAAAWLSGLRGADVSAVATEIQHAVELLDRCDGDPDGMHLIEGDVRKEFIQIAEKLDDFNNGRIGPGKCD